ncbi:hypothetical protein FOMA001_g14158 [Fusarium oxysporum f. sp. matthiolae]|nr:hypothetical protein FOMA001_g14158 [Fusarium oxysporum f. sp. matthiolae]
MTFAEDVRNAHARTLELEQFSQNFCQIFCPTVALQSGHFLQASQGSQASVLSQEQAY